MERILTCRAALLVAVFGPLSLLAQAVGQGGGSPDSLAPMPISAPVGQSLAQTLDNVSAERSRGFMDKVYPQAQQDKGPVQSQGGIIVTPSTRFIFGSQSAQDAQQPKPPSLPSSDAQKAPAQVQSQAASGVQKVKFCFKNADAGAVVGFIAELLGLTPVVSQDLTQQISVSTPGEVSPEEAFSILTAILNGMNYAAIRSDKLLKVIPKKDAPQSSLKISYGCDPDGLPASDEMITQIIPCRNVSAMDLLKYVAPLVSSTGGPGGNIAADPASNLLIVTESASTVRKVIQLVKFLDVASHRQFNDLVTTVYQINYLKAKDLAECLANAFKIKSALEVRNDSVVNNQIIVQPYAESNTIVVTASPELQKAVGSAIKEMDKRKKQVLLSVKFLETTDSRIFNAGSEFAYSSGNSAVDAGTSGTNKLIDSSKNPQFSYIFKNNKVNFEIQALLEKNKVKVLSQPRLLTSDNETAALTIGKQQPILKSTTSIAQTSNNNVVSDFSYVDIGIGMSVTPHINPEDDVNLNIDLKLTSILSTEKLTTGTDTSSYANVPVISNRQIKTALTVKHEHTLVICGIISKDYNEQSNTVPELGDIPWIGWMFGQAKQNRGQTELVILITPTVVDIAEDGDKVTARERKLINTNEDNFNDFGRFFKDGDSESMPPSLVVPKEGGSPAGEAEAKDARPSKDLQEPESKDGAQRAKDGGDASKAQDAKAEESKSSPSFFESLFQ